MKQRNNAFKAHRVNQTTQQVETPAIVQEVPVKKPKIGYKGFDKDLKCRDFLFCVGEVASKPEKKSLRLCSADGFHYCNQLEDVFEHYPNHNGHRFCEVEILGAFEDGGDKSITNSLKVIKEIPASEIDEIVEKLKVTKLGRQLGIDIIKKIQTAHPLVQVTGSTGLFLHGIRLKRWESGQTGDLDLVTPFYHQLEDNSVSLDEGTEEEQRSDACDFQQVVYIGGRKVDIRIDAKQRYEMIEYDGFKYRVSLLEHIMEAKFRYALQGNVKHRKDVYEICGKKIQAKTANLVDVDDDDILF